MRCHQQYRSSKLGTREVPRWSPRNATYYVEKLRKGATFASFQDEGNVEVSNYFIKNYIEGCGNSCCTASGFYY